MSPEASAAAVLTWFRLPDVNLECLYLAAQGAYSFVVPCRCDHSSLKVPLQQSCA